jgi:putative SOS response-associated peptidase YedK
MGALEEPKTNQGEDTFAIVTVEANETMMPVHDRQPAISMALLGEAPSE